MPWSALEGPAAYAIDPIYPSGAFLVLLLAASGLLLRRLWLFSLSLAPPALDGISRTVQAMWHWPRAKGVLMLLGAFVLLGSGSAVQWWQEQRRSSRSASSPSAGLADVGGPEKGTPATTPSEPAPPQAQS